MGTRSTMSGHIQESWYVPYKDRELRWMWESNRRVIGSLPLTNEWPPLTRRMFSFSPLSPSGAGGHVTPTYRGRVAYFGGSFSSLFREWDEWLEKFEGLLRRLYWEHAVVVLATEGMSVYTYEWRAAVGPPGSNNAWPPTPVQSWEFAGGPRSFDEG
jgi:hypothetical protein